MLLQQTAWVAKRSPLRLLSLRPKPVQTFLLRLPVFALAPRSLVAEITRVLEKLEGFAVALWDAFAVLVTVGEGEAGVRGAIAFAPAHEERGRHFT